MYLLETIRELFTLNGMINAINIIPQILASFSIGSLKIAANEIFIFAPVFNSPPERRSTRHDECQSCQAASLPKAAETFHSLHWCQRHFSTLAFHAQPAARGRTRWESFTSPSRRFPESVKAQREFSESFLSAEWENVAASSHEF